MDSQNFPRQFLRAVFHELFRSKNAYNIIASLTLLSLVALGYFWRETYIAEASIGYAQADAGELSSTTQSADGAQALIDLFHSRSFRNSSFANWRGAQAPWALNFADADAFFARAALASEANAALRLSVKSESPHGAAAALSAITDALITRARPLEQLQSLASDIAALEEQENRLRDELQAGEKEIVQLRAPYNVSATEGGNERIASIRASLQDVEVNINTVNAKIDGIRRQLEKEQAIHNARQQLAELESQRLDISRALAENREVYAPNAPQVVSLQQELDNITVAIARLREGQLIVADDAGVSLYEQLRKQLTLQEVEQESLLIRYDSLRNVLNSESRRISEGRTQEYEIDQRQQALEGVRAKYRGVIEQKEEMIARQRRIEGSLPDYFILHQASMPRTYTGMGFVEFLILGPIIAFSLPFGIAVLVVITDSRIRTTRQLKNAMPATVPLMGVIPHYNSPKTLRVFRKAILGLVAWGLFVFSVYITVGVIGLKG